MYNEIYGRLIDGTLDRSFIGNKFDVYMNEVGEHPTNEQLSVYTIPDNYTEIISIFEKDKLDKYEFYEKSGPDLINDVWTFTYLVKKLNDDEIAEIEAKNGNRILLQRLEELRASDWTQLPDSPLSSEKKAEWAAYRQAWRDITISENYPFGVLPVKPA